MGWNEIRPVRLAQQKKSETVKLGTRTRNGFTYGLLSMGAAIRDGRDQVKIEIDEAARRIRVTFDRAGAFKINHLHKGGGTILLPTAKWLPPTQFRALPITMVENKGTYFVVEWPEEWPAPPAAA
jgi:hypothetical protein